MAHVNEEAFPNAMKLSKTKTLFWDGNGYFIGHTTDEENTRKDSFYGSIRTAIIDQQRSKDLAKPLTKAVELVKGMRVLTSSDLPSNYRFIEPDLHGNIRVECYRPVTHKVTKETTEKWVDEDVYLIDASISKYVLNTLFRIESPKDLSGLENFLRRYQA